MSRISRGILLTACGLAVVGSVFLLPAAGDWLVTRDGSRIETEGPWRVESRLVVFKQKDGSLSSLRLSDVDLEASRRLTEEMAARAAAPAEVETPPKREAKIRLTQEDLPPAPPLPPRRDDGDEGEGEVDRTTTAPSGSQPVGSPLSIASFRETDTDDAGLAFTGTVQNRSENTAIGIGVTGILYDEEGEEIARSPARLSSNALQGGQTASFRADFPGVFTYARAEFEVAGDLLRTDPLGEPAEDDGFDEEAFDEDPEEP